jgi:hypothetical protein
MFSFSLNLIDFQKHYFIYSQTCIQRPPLVPEKLGLYAEGSMKKINGKWDSGWSLIFRLAIVDRWSLRQVWLYLVRFSFDSCKISNYDFINIFFPIFQMEGAILRSYERLFAMFQKVNFANHGNGRLRLQSQVVWGKTKNYVFFLF